MPVGSEGYIVKQRDFDTLEEFIEEQNNFTTHFYQSNPVTVEAYRKAPHFLRFQALYPDFERELSIKYTGCVNTRQEKPWEDLFKAYKLMSALVLSSDPYVFNGPEGTSEIFLTI